MINGELRGVNDQNGSKAYQEPLLQEKLGDSQAEASRWEDETVIICPLK